MLLLILFIRLIILLSSLILAILVLTSNGSFSPISLHKRISILRTKKLGLLFIIIVLILVLLSMAQPDPHTSASGSPCAAPGSQTLCRDGFRAEVLAIPFPNGYRSWMCRKGVRMRSLWTGYCFRGLSLAKRNCCVLETLDLSLRRALQLLYMDIWGYVPPRMENQIKKSGEWDGNRCLCRG